MHDETLWFVLRLSVKRLKIEENSHFKEEARALRYIEKDTLKRQMFDILAFAPLINKVSACYIRVAIFIRICLFLNPLHFTLVHVCVFSSFKDPLRRALTAPDSLQDYVIVERAAECRAIRTWRVTFRTDVSSLSGGRDRGSEMKRRFGFVGAW